MQKKNPAQTTLESCIFLNQCPPPEFDDHEDGLEEVYLPKHYLPEAPVFTGYDMFRYHFVKITTFACVFNSSLEKL